MYLYCGNTFWGVRDQLKNHLYVFLNCSGLHNYESAFNFFFFLADFKLQILQRDLLYPFFLNAGILYNHITIIRSRN